MWVIGFASHSRSGTEVPTVERPNRLIRFRAVHTCEHGHGDGIYPGLTENKQCSALGDIKRWMNRRDHMTALSFHVHLNGNIP